MMPYFRGPSSVPASVGVLALLAAVSCASACTEISGFYFVPFVDSGGNDIGQASGDLTAMSSQCRQKPSCLGFNTNGWMKYVLKPGQQWYTWTTDACQGTYVRVETNIEPTELTLDNGYWGDWSGWKRSQAGFFACGAQMRIEGTQGGGDDTAWNGLNLVFCNIADWFDRQTVSVHPGHWGGWGSVVMCPTNQYISGGQMRIEGPQGGGDDTAANGLQIKCANPTTWRSESWQNVNSGHWGDWRSQMFSKHQLVCAANVRVESPGGDDTALNGVKFQMCIPSGIQIEGAWQYVSNNPDFSFMTSYTTESGQETTNSQMFSMTATASAGFSIKGIDASTELSTTVESSMSQTISATLSQTSEVTCPSPCSADAPYMWRMDYAIKTPLTHGKLQPCSVYCTTHYIAPKCPLGSCLDEKSCQICCMDGNMIVPCSSKHFGRRLRELLE